MPLVIDASIALALSFPDKRDAVSLAAAHAIVRDRGVVPALWLWEVQQAIRNAERRGRINREDTALILRALSALPLDVEPVAERVTFGPEVDLVRRFGLTVYDAVYLALALRRGIPLATRDTALGNAANALGLLWSPA